jgi:hypothetical protein
MAFAAMMLAHFFSPKDWEFSAQGAGEAEAEALGSLEPPNTAV